MYATNDAMVAAQAVQIAKGFENTNLRFTPRNTELEERDAHDMWCLDAHGPWWDGCNLAVEDSFEKRSYSFYPWNAWCMPEGICVVRVKCTEFEDTFRRYVQKTREVPRFNAKDGAITQFIVDNMWGEPVIFHRDPNSDAPGGSATQLLRSIVEKHDMLKSRVTGVPTFAGVGTTLYHLAQKTDREQLPPAAKTCVLQRQKSLCACCKEELDEEYTQWDHCTPLFRGGSNEAGNFQALCVDCHKDKTANENRDANKDLRHSVYNADVCDIDARPESKTLAFVRTARPSDGFALEFMLLDKEESDDEDEEFPKSPHPLHKTIDLVLCRTSLLRYTDYSFPVFTPADAPQEYRGGAIECGRYLVKTDNTMPFEGCGWYYQPVVQYGLDEGIITKEDIVLEWLPWRQLPPNHFHTFIDTPVIQDLLAQGGDMRKIGKTLPLAVWGVMGQQTKARKMKKFTTDEAEWKSYFHRRTNLGMSPDCKVFLDKVEVEKDLTLYEAVFEDDVVPHETMVPLYNHLLQMEHVEMHRLGKAITEHGGRVHQYRTDAITYFGGRRIDLDQHEWAPGKPKYKYEDPKLLMNGHLCVQREDCREHYFPGGKFRFARRFQDIEDFQETFNKDDVDENAAQTQAFVEKMRGKSFAFEAPAGTGKTFIGRAIVDDDWTEHKRMQNTKFDSDEEEQKHKFSNFAPLTFLSFARTLARTSKTKRFRGWGS